MTAARAESEAGVPSSGSGLATTDAEFPISDSGLATPDSGPVTPESAIPSGRSMARSAALVMTLTIDRQALRTESSAVLVSMRQGFGFIFRHSTISFVLLSMTAGMAGSGARCGARSQ